MKSFFSDTSRAKQVLPYQIENSTDRSLYEVLRGALILSFSIPVGHSCRETWLVRLLLDDGTVVDFSAACTDVGSWREFGSLNIEIRDQRATAQDPASLIFEIHNVTMFRVSKIEQLVYEEVGLRVENGIVFTSEKGEEIWIVAAPAPGAVSLRAPSCDIELDTEIAVQECRRVPV